MSKKKRVTKGAMFFRTFIVILAILAIILGVVCGIGYWYIQDKLGKIDYDNLAADEIEVNSGIGEKLSGYRNIAIFGVDDRSDSYSGRSDCIIIVSSNQETKDVKLLSVYRDTYLELTGRSLDKVTHAYAYGGAKLALSTLNTNLDLNITEYVTINFDTVKTVVDAVGGVSINLTSAEAGSDDMKAVGITTAGTHRLNGQQALAYARIRKIDTDYKRTERMRNVLMAVFNKVKTLSVGQLNSLADTILPHVRTNISSGEILGLLPEVASFKIGDSIGWPYEVKGYTGAAWYAAPVTLEENVSRLHKELFNEEDYEPSENVKQISNSIINKTGYKN